MYLGSEKVLSNDLDKAIEYFDAILELNAQHNDALKFKVVSLILKGDFETSELILDDALSTNNNNVHFLLLKATILQLDGKYQQALDYLQRAQILASNIPEIAAQHAHLVFIIGEYTQAHKVLDDALSKHSNNSDLLYVKALTFFAQSKYLESEKYFNLAIKYDPQPKYFDFLSIVYYLLNDFDKFEQTNKKLSESYPSYTPLNAMLSTSESKRMQDSRNMIYEPNFSKKEYSNKHFNMSLSIPEHWIINEIDNIPNHYSDYEIIEHFEHLSPVFPSITIFHTLSDDILELTDEEIFEQFYTFDEGITIYYFKEIKRTLDEIVIRTEYYHEEHLYGVHHVVYHKIFPDGESYIILMDDDVIDYNDLAEFYQSSNTLNVEGYPISDVKFPPQFTSHNKQTSEKVVFEEEKETSEGGGCLIATATYGTELAPQVQQLRELRDNKLLQTESGTNFMNSFNEFYYSFSPTVADLERENPVFKEIVKIAITPMISSLSILNYVDMNSESETLGYGISLIILNLAMYIGILASVIVGIQRKLK